MDKRKFFPGQEIEDTDLNDAVNNISDYFDKTIQTFSEYGIVPVNKLKNDSNYPSRWDFLDEFPISFNGLNISIGFGIAYDRQGRRIIIDENKDYDANNLNLHDSLGNLIVKSTGNQNIVLPYSTTYIYIKYVEVTDTSTNDGEPPADNYTIDPDTGIVKYIKYKDGYAIEMYDAPNNDPDLIYIGTVTQAGSIDITGRVFSRIAGDIISTNLTSQEAETTQDYSIGTLKSFKEHINAVGDLTKVNKNNPHGITIDNIPDLNTFLGTYAKYAYLFHTNTLILPLTISGNGPLYPTVQSDGSNDYVNLAPIDPNEFLVIKFDTFIDTSTYYSEVMDTTAEIIVKEENAPGNSIKSYFPSSTNYRNDTGYYVICMRKYESGASVEAVFIDEVSNISIVDLVDNPYYYVKQKLGDEIALDYMPVAIVDYEYNTGTASNYIENIIDPRDGLSKKVIDVRQFGNIDSAHLMHVNDWFTFRKNVNIKNDLKVQNTLKVEGTAEINNLIVTSSEGISLPRWVKFTKSFSDFAVANTINSINLYELAPAGIIHAVKIKHSESFNISNYKIAVGIAGALDKYASYFDINQTPGDTIFQLSNGLFSENHANPTQILVTAKADSNLDTATSGQVSIWLLISTAED